MTTAVAFEYWQSKKTGEVFAVKMHNGAPTRFCGPLRPRQYRAPDGRLLTLKLHVLHYGFRFHDDPYNYLLCD